MEIEPELQPSPCSWQGLEELGGIPSAVATPAPRLDAAARERLKRAEACSDLGSERNRFAVQLKRDRDRGMLSEEGAKRFDAALHKRGAEKLQLFRDWADGLLTQCEGPKVTQRVAEVLQDDTEDRRGWMNWHELLIHTGGHVNDGQKTYATKLWRNAAKGPEREHPDGPALPKQRHFWVATLEIARSRKEERAQVDLADWVADTDELHHLMELLGKRPSVEAVADGAPAAKKAKVGEPAPEQGPPLRESLLRDYYKAIPKVYAVSDRIPSGAWGDMARAKMDPALQQMLKAKGKLETPGRVEPHELVAMQHTLKQGLGVAMTLHKLIATMLSGFEGA